MVLIWSVSFQSFVLQLNVRYSIIAVVCNIRKLSNLRIMSQQEETGVISSTFNAALTLFLTKKGQLIGAASGLETIYTVKALVSNCLRNPCKRFITKASRL